jgi:YD repeat-containing protein
MAAVVSGNSLGLLNTSLYVLGSQSQGTAALGQAGGRVYINAATGNLVVQNTDEVLLGRGPDANLLRTYNSQGLQNDDNGDNWRLGVYRKVYNVTGALNTAGSTVRRVAADGSESLYTYDTTRGLYVSTDGAGAFDTLSYAASTQQWTFTDGTTQTQELYDGANGGRITRVQDTDGNSLTFSYNAAGLVTQVTDASGETTYLDYSGNNLTDLRTVTASGQTLVRTRYVYDTSNRLTQAITDLSPSDASIADGNTYTVSYTYDGASDRIASIVTGDGASMVFGYDAQGRVTSYAQGSNPAVSLSYATPGQTDVTDALGNVTSYKMDGQGQLTEIDAPAVNGARAVTSYSYDASGNVASVTDALGNVTTYQYDANGNRVLDRDAAGNTITRTYDSRNELLTQTVYLVPDPDGAGPAQPGAPQTTRYVYSAQNHLRFTVSAEGRVTEYRYNGFGQQVAGIQYDANFYPLAGLNSGDAPSEAQLSAWVAGADKSKSQRIDTAYDFRGQVASTTSYASVDAAGNGVADGTQSVTQYVYDQAGNLLSTIDPRGSSTSYVHDGLGRVLSTTDALGRSTLNTYDDANRRTVLTLANGLVTTSTYDSAGNLVSIVQSADGVGLGQTTYSYDADGRLRSTVDPTGVQTYVLYDAAGRRTGTIDGTGTLTEYRYDADANLTKTIRYATAVSAASLALLTDAQAHPTGVSLDAIRPAASAADQVTYNAYDAANRLVKSIDAAGAVTQYFYDGTGQVTETLKFATTVDTSGLGDTPSASSINPPSSAADRLTRNFYDADGNLRGTLDGEGYLVEYKYDAAGELVETVGYATATDPSLRVTGTLAQLIPAASSADIHTYTLYNAKGQVAGTVDGEGYLTELVYDNAGNKTQTIRYATRVAYTAGATLASLRPAANSQDQVQSASYNALNQTASSTDVYGTVTQYFYDEVGNLTQAVKAAGTSDARTLLAQYDRQGHLTAQLSGNGAALLTGNQTQAEIDAIWAANATKYTYDAAGRKTSSTDADGNTTLYFYNADGALTHSINALGEVNESVYNALGQVTQTIQYGTRLSAATLSTLSGGLVTSTLTTALAGLANASVDSTTGYAYTTTGNVAQTTDALGNTMTQAFDAFGDMIASSQAIGGGQTLDHTYAYDRRGLLTQTVWDPTGANTSTSTVYDAFGRAIRQTDARGNVTTLSYDRLGRTVTVTDPLNQTSVSSYDAFDRLLAQTDALGNTTTYQYDTANRAMSVTTPEGIVTTAVKNRYGQTVSVTDGLGNTTSYQYDKDGNLVRTDAPAAGSTLQLYDNADLLIETVDGNGTKTDYTYDAAGRVLTKTRDPGVGHLNLVTTYAFDAKGQTVSTTDATGVVTQASFDLKGQVVSVVVDPGAGHLNLTTTYTYDARSKKLSVTEGAGSASPKLTLYAYDKLGRLIRQTVDPDGVNATTTYAYDNNNNLSTKTDPDGNVTLYAHDADDRLVYAVDAAGGVGKDDYDANGNVIRITEYATAIDLTGLSNTPTVADIAARIVTSATDATKSYVFDGDGREIYCIDATGAVTQKSYDANGNVVRSVQYANVIPLATPLTQAAVAAALVPDAANDQVARSVYDAADRLVYAIDALGYVKKTQYDNVGNVIKTVDYAQPIFVSATPSVAEVEAALAPESEPVSASNQTTASYVNPTQPYTYSASAQNDVASPATQTVAVTQADQTNSTPPVQPYTYVASAKNDVATPATQSATLTTSFNGTAEQTSWSSSVQPAGTTATFLYRVTGSGSAYTAASVSTSGGTTVATYAALFLFGINLDYIVQYTDGFGRVLSSASGTLTPSLRTTTTATATFNYTQITSTPTTGSSISGYIPLSQVSSIDHVSATVTNAATGAAVSSALTYPEFEASYNGEVNLSVGSQLANGAYNVAITIYYKNGTVTNQPVFRYEIGPQGGSITHTVSWAASTAPAGTTASFGYRVQGSGAAFTSATVTTSGANQQVAINNIAAGTYEYQIQYKDAYGRLLKSASSAFTVTGSGTTTANTTFNYTQITSTTTTGSSITGYITAAEVPAIDYVDATVRDLAGNVVSTARTYPEFEPSYNGRVNLSVGAVLADGGKFNVSIVIHKKDGTVDTRAPFYYEVGPQLQLQRATTVSWQIPDDTTGTSVQFSYAPAGSSSFTSMTATQNGGSQSVSLANLADGSYTYTVSYFNGTQLVRQGAGTFVSSASGTTSGQLQFQSPASSDPEIGKRVSKFVYDAVGRLVYAIDALGHVTETQYDNVGDITKTIQYAEPIFASSTPTLAEVAAALAPASEPVSAANQTNTIYVNPTQPYTYSASAQNDVASPATQTVAVTNTDQTTSVPPVQPYTYVASAKNDVATPASQNVTLTTVLDASGAEETSWASSVQPAGTTATFLYRVTGSGSAYTAASVSTSGGTTTATYAPVFLLGMGLSFDYVIQYTDGFGRVLSSASGTLTPSFWSASTATATFNYTQITSTPTSGSSISGCIPLSQVSSIDHVSATVTDANTGAVVSSALTYPEFEASYNGEVNLSVGSQLANGAYNVAVTIYYKNGTVTNQPVFRYEIGTQSTFITHTLSWAASTAPAGTTASFGYRVQGSTGAFTSAAVTTSGANQQVALDHIAAGTYEYQIQYRDSYGRVLKSASGTFTVAASGTTTTNTTFNYTQVTSTAATGSSITGYITAAEVPTIDYVDATVRDLAGNVVSTARTYPEFEPAYNGRVNLSVGSVLPDGGKFNVSIVIHKKDGTVDTRVPFYYEVGPQPQPLRTTTISWQVPDNATSASVQFSYAPTGSTSFTNSAVTQGGNSQSVSINGLPDGSYTYLVSYVLKGRVVREATGTFASSASGTTSGQLQFVNGTLLAQGSDQAKTYVYDAAGRMLSATDAQGLTESYTYDALGNKLSFTDKNGNTWTYVYDADGREIYCVDALGDVTQKTYDAAGNVIREVKYANPIAASVARTQAAVSAALVPDPANDRATLTVYDADYRPVYSIDALGYVKETQYDALGEIVKTIQYMQAITVSATPTLAEVAAALAPQSTGAAGASREIDAFTYDADGRLVTSTDAEGFVERYGYDAQGNEVSFTNKKGDTWNYAYDRDNRLVSELDPSIEVDTVTDSAAAIGITSGQARLETRMSYDAFGDVIASTEANGRPEARTTQYQYDALGRQVATLFPTVNVYNAAGDNLAANGVDGTVVREEIAATPQVTVGYDAFGNAVVSRDAAGNYSYRVYDASNRLKYEIDAERYVTEYGYDGVGNQTSVTRYATALNFGAIGSLGAHADGVAFGLSEVAARLAPSASDRTITTQYDAMDRAVLVTQPAAFTYDSSAPAGSPSYFTVGATTRDSYDAFGDLVKQSTLKNPGADGIVGTADDTWLDSFSYYDRRGSKTAQVDAAGFLSTSQYDAAGNVVRQVQYAHALQANSWSISGYGTPVATTPQSDPDSAIGFDREVDTQYDRKNQKTADTQVDVEYGTVTGTVTLARAFGDLTTHYSYDAVGNLISVVDPAGGTSLAQYDALGRLSATVSPQLVDVNGNSILPLTTFHYDAFGDMVQTTKYAQGATATLGIPAADPNDQTTLNAYDSLGHLIHTIDPEGAAKFNSYDVMGRLAKSWAPITDVNGVVNNAIQSFSYDKLGRQISVKQAASLTNLVAQLQPGATRVQQAFLNWSVTGGGTQLAVSWDSLDGLGAGDVRVDVDYSTVTRDESGNVISTTPMSGSETFSSGSAVNGATVQLSSSVDVVNRVRVWKKQANGQWGLIADRSAPGAYGNHVVLAAPMEAGVQAQLLYRPSGSGGAWSSVSAEAFQAGYLLDATALGTGNYDFQVDYFRSSEPAPYAVMSGTLMTAAGAGGSVGSSSESLGAGGFISDDTRYNAFGEVVAQGTNGGFQEFSQYDNAGRVWRTNSGDGVDKVFFYDTQGKQTSVITSQTLDLLTAYSDPSQLQGSNPAVERTDTMYDVLERPTQQIAQSFAGGSIVPVVSQTLDRWGNTLSFTDARGDTTHYRYDYGNRVVLEKQPETDVWGENGTDVRERPTTRYFYDQAGRALGTIDANGNASSKRYDSGGLLLADYHADGGVVSYGYDGLGREVRSIDELGRVTNYSYDHDNRLVQIQHPIGTETYRYDQAGNRIQTTNAAGETNTYWYDTSGHLLRSQLPMGQQTRYSYDLRGDKVVEENADTDQQSWSYDHFGRLLAHTDLGGGAYTYAYDKAGEVVQQTLTRGSAIGVTSYEYYENGLLKRMVDSGVAGETTYEYDAAGNRTRETYVKGGTLIDDHWTSYDELGRLESVVGNRFQKITYRYDAVGNRRAEVAQYTDESGNPQLAIDWYQYDSMNRVTLSKGELSGGQIQIDPNRSSSVSLAYDAAGNRRVAASYQNGSLVTDTYTYDGDNRLLTDTRNGVLASAQNYDGAGRITEQFFYQSSNSEIGFGGPTSEHRVNTYNQNGWITQQQIYDFSGNSKQTTDYTGYDGVGNVTSYQVAVHTGTAYTNYYSNTYAKYDIYKQQVVQGTSTYFQPGNTTTSYDINGNILSVVDQFGGTGTRTFVTDGGGLILEKTQNGQTQNFFYVNGQSIGTSGALSGGDFGRFPAGSLGGLELNSVLQDQSSQAPDLTSDYTAVSDQYPTLTPQSYVVVQGDTLRSLAFAFYGDAQLWYLIADANGLSGNSDLVVGQRLTIPNLVVNAHNDYQTFQPYNALKIVGDTTPTLPAPPQPSSGDGCGGFGAILVAIIAIVVTIVLTPIATSLFAPIFGAGSVAAGVAGAAVAAAAGSIVSQGVGIAIGVQSKFNWGAVAVAALSAGISEGVGLNAPNFSVTGNAVIDQAIQGAAKNVIQQGVAIIVGTQKSFSWAALAGAAVTGAVTGALGGPTTSSGQYNFAAGFAGNLAGGVVRAALQGGKIDFAMIAADAFGNALGTAIGTSIAQNMGQQAQQLAQAQQQQQQQTQPEEDDEEEAPPVPLPRPRPSDAPQLSDEDKALQMRLQQADEDEQRWIAAGRPVQLTEADVMTMVPSVDTPEQARMMLDDPDTYQLLLQLRQANQQQEMLDRAQAQLDFAARQEAARQAQIDAAAREQALIDQTAARQQALIDANNARTPYRPGPFMEAVENALFFLKGFGSAGNEIIKEELSQLDETHPVASTLLGAGYGVVRASLETGAAVDEFLFRSAVSGANQLGGVSDQNYGGTQQYWGAIGNGVSNFSVSNVPGMVEAEGSRLWGLYQSGRYFELSSDIAGDATTVAMAVDGGIALTKLTVNATRLAVNTGRVIGDFAMDTGRVVGDFAVDTGRVIGDFAVDTGRVIGDFAVDTGRVMGDLATNPGRVLGNLAMDAGQMTAYAVGRTLDALSELQIPLAVDRGLNALLPGGIPAPRWVGWINRLGQMAEEAAYETMVKRLGYESMNGKFLNNAGFDGVWVKWHPDGWKPIDIIISESKWSSTGEARLTNTWSMGQQLSNQWIDANIAKMLNSWRPSLQNTGQFLTDYRDMIRVKANVLGPDGYNRWNRIALPVE